MRIVICLLLLIVGTNPVAISQGQSQDQDFEELLARLKHPANIAVELARRVPEQNEKPEDVNKPFEPGERLYFRILLTNTSMHPLTVIISNPYFHSRPKLMKDALEIPYRDEKMAKPDSVRDMQQFSGRSHMVRLEPSVPKYVDRLDLNDWYASLKAGRYELTNKYRFVPYGDWLESPPITFEVRREKQLRHVSTRGF